MSGEKCIGEATIERWQHAHPRQWPRFFETEFPL